MRRPTNPMMMMRMRPVISYEHFHPHTDAHTHAYQHVFSSKLTVINRLAKQLAWSRICLFIKRYLPLFNVSKNAPFDSPNFYQRMANYVGHLPKTKKISI